MKHEYELTNLEKIALAALNWKQCGYPDAGHWSRLALVNEIEKHFGTSQTN